MDRTSILGDTIDYMKELLGKINKLREEGKDENLNQMANLEDLKPKEIQVRNHPKVCKVSFLLYTSRKEK